MLDPASILQLTLICMHICIMLLMPSIQQVMRIRKKDDLNITTNEKQ